MLWFHSYRFQSTSFSSYNPSIHMSPSVNIRPINVPMVAYRIFRKEGFNCETLPRWYPRSCCAHCKRRSGLCSDPDCWFLIYGEQFTQLQVKTEAITFSLSVKHIMSLESWAVDKLSQFLGIDDETLKTQVLPYLLSYDSPDALQGHLMVRARHLSTALFDKIS